MKVQELAKELNIDLRDFISFLNSHGFRRKKASTKLDPGSTSKIKHLYRAFLEKKASSQEKSFEAKVISFSEESIKVSELSTLFAIPMQQIMKTFLTKGLMVNLNSEINTETLTDIAAALNITIELEDQAVEKELGLKTKVLEIESDEIMDTSSKSRPPVVTILGHVDHGKTLLLDYIRKANIADKESGGITQHIGAYQISHNQKKLTFLDTPGHEAFTSLRARGAQITDIAILVVAADDGVKPQTIEAINHVQIADVPIIVAINKMDKPEANVESVKQQLSQYNLLSEDWGGQTVMVPVSAKTGEGIPELLEMIQLITDMQELKYNPKSKCKAVIIESELSSKKGPIATVIVKAGTLSTGNFFVADGIQGKVRAILNEHGQKEKTLFPGDPGIILGFPSVPQPGTILETHDTEKECRKLAQAYIEKQPQTKKANQKMSVSLEALSSQAEEGTLRQLNLIIKADVHGSLEAIKGSIEKVESKDIPIKIIHYSTGSINENDVLLAKASNGIVFGFNAEPSIEAKKCASEEKVTVKTYSVIYDILDDIERVIQGLYKPEFVEEEWGEVEVRELFKFSKVGTIAGCYILKGKIDRNCSVRVKRNKSILFETKIDSLKRFKDDVKEVLEGYECGIVLKDNTPLQPNDVLLAYKVSEKQKSI